MAVVNVSHHLRYGEIIFKCRPRLLQSGNKVCEDPVPVFSHQVLVGEKVIDDRPNPKGREDPVFHGRVPHIRIRFFRQGNGTPGNGFAGGRRNREVVRQREGPLKARVLVARKL
jgi:hypothetical protein